MPEELFFQGDVVAIVAAETEDLAEDAAEAIEVEYEVLPFAANLAQIMSPNAPDLSRGGEQRRGNLTTSLAQYGDVEKGFQEADIVKEFTYYYAGAFVAHWQLCGSWAKGVGAKERAGGLGQASYRPGR